MSYLQYIEWHEHESDMNEPVYHHYVSAGYLRGFAKSGKHYVIHCIDLDAKKGFPQNVKKVAGEDHFNRLDGHPDPNILETTYANELEGPSLGALKRVLECGNFSNAVDREAVLLLFSLFAARNPRDRQSLAESIQPLNQILIISALGQEGLKSPWAAAALEMNTSKHALLELNVIGGIHQCLLDRKWIFLKAGENSPGFVTSDYPVNLIPHPYRIDDGWGLGFALKDVSVFIPLNKNLAVIGDYEATERIISLDREAVAALNSSTIRNATRQIYAYSDEFEFIGPGNKMLNGKELPKVL